MPLAAVPLSPPAEARRLATLRRYGVLGSAPATTFDRLARLAAGSLVASGAAIGFVGEQRVYYKAFYSAAGQMGNRSFPRSQTLCAAAAFQQTPLVLEDVAAAGADLLSLAFVRQNRVRFYVGVPLTAPSGAVLGALSVFDTAPRTLESSQLELLETLAQTVGDVLEQQRDNLDRAEAARAETHVGELLEHAPYYAFTTTADGQLDYLSGTLKRALGYPSPPEHYRALYAGDVQDEVATAFQKALKEGQAELGTTLQTSSGALIPISQTLTRLARPQAEGAVSPAAGVAGVAGVAYDTTGQRQRAMLDQKRAEVLELIARGAPLPAVLLELITLLETSCAGLVGAVFLVHQGTLQLEVAPQLPSAFAQLVRELPLSAVAAAPGVAALQGRRVLSSDIRRDPLWHHLRYFALQNGLQACWAEPILSDQHESLGTVVLYAHEPKTPSEAEGRLLHETAQLAAIAVSRQKLYAQLEHQAHYDALTNLPNRRLLGEHLGRAVRQAQAHSEHPQNEGVGVFLLDLDDFKRVNDALGHAAGDTLLSAVAKRLQAHVQTHLPARTTLARSGGDEFVFTVPLTYQGDAARFAFDLERAFSDPFRLGERTLQVGASIGVSRFPEDARTAQTLLQAADTAMYAAKADRQAGSRQGYRLYKSEMTEQLEAQLKLEAELKRALIQGEFRIFSQPRFDLKTQRVVAAEVLLRWEHPHQGLLLPGAFLGGAQQAGLLPQLDAWVLAQVTRHLSEQATAGKPVQLSCNVSAASFQDATFLHGLETALGENPEVAKSLELEITESLLMQNLAGVAAQLADLKGRFPGIRIAIDDFGSGYSSLAYLRHLPIDTLKIDRVFVRDLDHRNSALQRTALAVIRTVIALGHDLGFRVVAEGAETEAQLGMLTALGVDEVQGFAVGRPQLLAPLSQEASGSSAEKSASSSEPS